MKIDELKRLMIEAAAEKIADGGDGGMASARTPILSGASSTVSMWRFAGF
jgi:hypothetical protein